jgi:hypothetical protein
MKLQNDGDEQENLKSRLSPTFYAAVHFIIHYLFAVLGGGTVHLLLVLPNILMRLLGLLMLMRGHRASMHTRAENSKAWAPYNAHRAFQV